MSAVQQLLHQTNKLIPSLDAEILLAHVLKKPREFLLIHPEFVPSAAQVKKFNALARRRALGEPVAYLIGHKEFFGLDFAVDKRVLVPRPETELLVEEALAVIARSEATKQSQSDKKIKKLAASQQLQKSKIKNRDTVLIDIGTGSGCVPIAIIKTLKHKNIKTIAIDISQDALAVARRNARAHGVKIKFLHGNLLSPLLNKSYMLHVTCCNNTIITANLPYLPGVVRPGRAKKTGGWKEWKNNCSMETRGLKFEPSQALFTGNHGLQLYEELLQQITKVVSCYKLHVTCLLEFDPRQTTRLKKLIKKYLPGASVEIKKDLAGRDRVAVLSC